MPDRNNLNQENDRDATTTLPIPFRGALSVPDVYEAVNLVQPLGNKIAIWIVRVFLAVALAYMCWLTVYAYSKGDFNLARMALAGVIFVMAPICVAIGRAIWSRKREHQLWQEKKQWYALSEGEIDGESIRSKSEAGESTLNWSALCGYRASENVAVLFYYHYPGSFGIMARSKFNNDQNWFGFLELASQKLKKI